MHKYFLLVFWVLPTILLSQSTDFQTGILPSVTFGYSPVRDLRFTGKLESMQSMSVPSEEGNFDWDYSYKRTDVQLFLGNRINPFWSFTGGIQFRFNNSTSNSQRFIQQLTYVQPGAIVRLGHRLRTDQTISNSEPFRFRVRYRFSVELALQGQEVDQGEFYLTLSEELIYINQKNEQDLENRSVISLGYYLNETHRFEFGPDFRIKNISGKDFHYRLWVSLGWRVRI